MRGLSSHPTKSIRIRTDGFSLLKNEGEKKILKKDFFDLVLSVLPQYALDFLAPVSGETLQVVVDTTAPLLIPKPLFAEEDLWKYLRMQFPVDSRDKPFFDEWEEYYAVYFLEYEVIHNLNKLDTPFQTIHQTTLCHHHGKALARDLHATAILYLNRKDVDVVFWKNNKLQIVNKYNYSGNTDILYYLLNISKQFDLALDELDLRFLQEAPKDLLLLLRKFFPLLTLEEC